MKCRQLGHITRTLSQQGLLVRRTFASSSSFRRREMRIRNRPGTLRTPCQGTMREKRAQ